MKFNSMDLHRLYTEMYILANDYNSRTVDIEREIIFDFMIETMIHILRIEKKQMII